MRQEGGVDIKNLSDEQIKRILKETLEETFPDDENETSFCHEIAAVCTCVLEKFIKKYQEELNN